MNYRAKYFSIFLLVVMAAYAPLARAQPTGPADATKALTDAAIAAFQPLRSAIMAAKVSRATVRMTVRSMLGEETLQEDESVFQVASAAPNRYTVFLKSTDQSFRIFCDGKKCAVLCSPTAYYPAEVGKDLQAVVASLPAPLGPYPEPVIALTLCGVDPALSMINDMRSIEVVDHEDYQKEPAVRLRGIQEDGVEWDLWIATTAGRVRPMRMLIDLTAVVGMADAIEMPANFRFEMDLSFELWRTTGEVNGELFTFVPTPGIKQYESLDAYLNSLNAVANHPMLGRQVNELTGNRLSQPTPDDDSKAVPITDADWKGKVVVIDFWASWCEPCIEAIPTLKSVVEEFKNDEVAFLTVNTGEDDETVKKFLAANPLPGVVLLDPDGKIAEQFAATAIPLTIIMDRRGVVQSVHVGYSSLIQFQRSLVEEIGTLVDGGTLIDVEAAP